MNVPLAERIRPNTLEGYLSQQHLIGPKGAITIQIKSGMISSMIFGGLQEREKPLWPILLPKPQEDLFIL